MVPKGLAGEDVREMDLDDGQRNRRQGIAQRHTGVRKTRRIDQDPRGRAHRFLDSIDELPFVIRLEAVHLDSQLLGRRRQIGVDLP